MVWYIYTKLPILRDFFFNKEVDISKIAKRGLNPSCCKPYNYLLPYYVTVILRCTNKVVLTYPCGIETWSWSNGTLSYFIQLLNIYLKLLLLWIYTESIKPVWTNCMQEKTMILFAIFLKFLFFSFVFHHFFPLNLYFESKEMKNPAILYRKNTIRS